MNTKTEIMSCKGKLKANTSSHVRPVTLVPFVSKDEREELDDLSDGAKEGHSLNTKHCEMCNDKNRPCWIPHRIRYSGY